MLTAEGYSVNSRWIDSNGEEWVNGQDNHSSLLSDPTNTYAPTKANIAADLSAMGNVVARNDVFVFYFSGHGMQDTT